MKPDTMEQRGWVNVVAGVLVVVAALVLVWNVVSTSSARVAATTSGESFFSAGTVSLTQPDAAVEMLFDANGMYPGLEVTGCVEVEYTGTVPASIRIHADESGGTGLAEYIDLQMSVEAADSCDAEADAVAGLVYNGRLHSLWLRHANFDEGILVLEPARPGDGFSLRAVVSVADDNRAQNLTTEFSITIEARP